MRLSLRKAFVLLSILCLGAVQLGAIAAEDQSGSSSSSETYGAYPGAPTSATGQPAVVGAYPSGPTAAYPTHPEPTTPISAGQPAASQIGAAGPANTGAATAIYSTQAPPATQQRALLSYDVQAVPPTTVYYSGSFMDWATFYQRFPRNSPALWVASSAGWSWYATCPLGGWIRDLMYVPYTGTMKLYEFYPDGSVKLYSYGFATPGYKYIWFYADTPGRHLTLFTIFDKPSNYITIDVM